MTQDRLVQKASWVDEPRRKREQGVYERLKAHGLEFGLPDCAGACEYAMLNTGIFVPEDDTNIQQFHWDIFRVGPPSFIERRIYCVLLLEQLGRSLNECKTAFELFEAILHGLLGEFLSTPASQG
jgi:hypothetical protein